MVEMVDMGSSQFIVMRCAMEGRMWTSSQKGNPENDLTYAYDLKNP
jgi:hypothetical protein